jgi:hypothetical protein
MGISALFALDIKGKVRPPTSPHLAFRAIVLHRPRNTTHSLLAAHIHPLTCRLCSTCAAS